MKKRGHYSQKSQLSEEELAFGESPTLQPKRKRILSCRSLYSCSNSSLRTYLPYGLTIAFATIVFAIVWLLRMCNTTGGCEANSANSAKFIPGRGFGNASLRYLEVPSSICELERDVRSYSGYVDISEHEHIFFWFFEARRPDPENAPLTAWISGGPGDSSMCELFTEHGPCRVNPDGKTIVPNPFSWNNHSNILYIDQPVHVGFSYTELVSAYIDGDSEDIVELKAGAACPHNAEVCGQFSRPVISTTANSTVAAAPKFWITLQAFMATFPQYSKNGFHFGSESYGGHYVPIFSRYIQDQNNKNIQGAKHIDLKSVLVGNGWFSPQLQTESYYKFGFDPGNTYDVKASDSTLQAKVHDAYYGQGKGRDQFQACETTGDNEICIAADNFNGEMVQDVWIDAIDRDNNDIRQKDPSPFPNRYYVQYLRRPEVRQAIGAEQTFIQINPTVSEAFDSTGDDGRELGILGIIADLTKNGVGITLYAGDADYECNWMGVEAVANAIGIAGFDAAGYTDIMTADDVVHGQVKQTGNFSFVRVYEAGHAVGAFQPQLLETIFARTIVGKDLATGRVEANPEYRTDGSKNSTYREGGGTVQDRVWPAGSMYDYITNLPTSKNFQPTWNGST